MKLILLCILINCFVNPTAYSQCYGKTLTIGIVDTGFGFEGKGVTAPLCKVGHKDFTEDQKFLFDANTKVQVPMDLHGHGTNIAGVIESFASGINHCLVILKYWQSGIAGYRNLLGTVAAFKEATALKLDFVNYSGGGQDPSNEEKEAVEAYLATGGTLVVAAGNYGHNIDNPSSSYYPAGYDRRTIVVGMLEPDGHPAQISNFGNIVNRWEIGRNVIGFGLSMSGTSQATATATGKLLSQRRNNRCENVTTRH